MTIHINELEKAATEAKAAGDMDRAVTLLRKSKLLQGDDYQSTRLAKFLQHAGRAEEALQEIQWVVDHSARWARQMFGHQAATVVQCQLAGHVSRIYKDAELICKRAKMPEHQANYARLSAEQAALYVELRSQSDAAMKAKRTAWENTRAGGRVGMKRFE